MPADQKPDRDLAFHADPLPGLVDGGVRLVVTILGIIVILVGLWLAIKIFGAIYSAATGPEAFAPTIKQWTEAVGGEKLKLTYTGGELQLAPVLAILFLGGSGFLLTWLAMGIMLTGAKIIAWTSGEREAIKRILQQAFPPTGRRP